MRLCSCAGRAASADLGMGRTWSAKLSRRKTSIGVPPWAGAPAGVVRGRPHGTRGARLLNLVELMRIPVIPSSSSGASRPLVPAETVHLFRTMPSTRRSIATLAGSVGRQRADVDADGLLLWIQRIGVPPRAKV